MNPRCARLYQYPQLDSVVRCVNEVLFGSQIPLGRLDRRVAQKQLNLLKLPAGGAAQLCRRATKVMWGQPGDSTCAG